MQKRTYIYLVIIVALVLAVLIYLNISASPNAGKYAPLLPYINKPVPQQALSELNVSAAISNRLGAGAVSGLPEIINASPLVNGTKPEVLYVGAEYCPFCAVTRWGLIIALMRFGSFSNLHYMVSNTTNEPELPGVPTFTFYNSAYNSNYLSFVAVETETNTEKPLQQITGGQSAIFSKYDPTGGIPFIDFGNGSIQDGAPVSPEVLLGQGWNTTLENLTHTNTSISESIVGSADVFTAQICRITNMTPASVCSQPYINTILKGYG